MSLWLGQEVQTLPRSLSLTFFLALARYIATLCVGLWALVGSSLAQDVTLSSRDGGIEVSGTLIGFDGEFYRIRSEYGDLTLDGTGVICDGPGCPDLSAYVARVGFSGSDLMGQRLMPLLLDAFSKDAGYDLLTKPDDEAMLFVFSEPKSGDVVAEFRISSVTNSEGFAHLVAGTADIAMSTRAALPNETALVVEAGLGNLESPQQSKVIALDAIVPIVSGRNPLRQISIEQLSALFRGDVAHWSDLNGVDAPVYAHIHRGDVAAYLNFLEGVLLPGGHTYGPNTIFHDEMSGVLSAVAADPFAVGLARNSDTGGGRVLDLVGECGFASDATAEALKAEDYPLAAPMFLYWRGARLPRIARELLQFLETPAAQIAVVRAGFVDQGITRTDLKRQGDRLVNGIRQARGDEGMQRLQDLVDDISDRSRLSLSFRFMPGTRGLDPQSRSNVRLLANALESGTLGVSDVMFVGFASPDGESGTEGALSLSEQRAKEVERRVLNAAATIDRRSLRVGAKGYGNIMPLACNTELWGQHLNNRVEVWVR